ncbi:MAG: ATP-grasp domain-containing protein [Campylobacterales bacterium]|nr:ATP-grasp domain-containing protein [Campylobacterales bacterium]
MKKVLLIDTAFAAMPIYNYLIQNNCEVWVMGNREQDALALQAGVHWIKQDYSDVAAVKEHIKNNNIEFVVPGCTDISIETALQLDINSDVFDTVEAYDSLANKNKFRELCEKLDLPAPKVVDLQSFPREGKYICKPVDAFSGRGVTVVDGQNFEDVRSAYEFASNESRTKKAIIEDYVDGQLYSFSAFIEKHNVKDFFIVKEGSSVNPYAVDTSYVDDLLEESIVQLMQKSIEKLSEHLSLKNGLLHTQFILSDGKPYMIELSRRCPGDLYSYLIKSSTGFEYAAKYASYFIKEKQPSLQKYTKHIIRHTIASEETKRFLNLKFVSEVQPYAYFPLLGLGNTVEENQKTRVGILFTESLSYEKLRYDYEQYMQRKVYVLDQLK